ncbi:MAG TPA: preprotein translocase subunit SecE [Armatimonadota bacterium]|nr:preprotein translocase subunit SecE [Armatimonadota bacterium]HQK92270.1 preprotein translocase subunit SecE [Armatimonadota bacterium]
MGTAEGIAPVRWFRSFRGFIREATAELKRVVWPTWDELKGYTYLVLLVIAVVAVWLGLLEFVLAWLTNKVGLYGRG